MTIEEKLIKYGKSAKGNFEIIDTIGVPHPYCITPRHMLPDHMYMNGDTIREAERTNKAVCDICKQINRKDYSKPILSYDEHEQALLVACYLDFKTDKEAEKELREYLLSIKDEAVKDHYAGFSFIDRSKK